MYSLQLIKDRQQKNEGYYFNFIQFLKKVQSTDILERLPFQLMHCISLSAFTSHQTALFTHQHFNGCWAILQNLLGSNFQVPKLQTRKPTISCNRTKEKLSVLYLEEQPSTSYATVVWPEMQRNTLAFGFSISICMLKLEFGSKTVYSHIQFQVL